MVNFDAVGSFWFFIYLPCGRSAENFQPFSFQFLWDGSDSLSPINIGMRYTSDLTPSEWDLISYCFPKTSSFGRPRKYPYLEIFNGILYVNKTGCQWRNVPKDLPPWQPVLLT